MDDFLTPISTTKVKRTQNARPFVQETENSEVRISSVTIDTPEQAAKILTQQPDLQAVESVLEYLVAEGERRNGFHLVLPDPTAANIVFRLVTTTVPDYWQILKGSRTQSQRLVTCLRNPCGIGNIITRLRPLIEDCQVRVVGETRNAASHIIDLVEILEILLLGESCLCRVWNNIKTHGKSITQTKMMWKEFVAQVASGRILALAAEAEDSLKERDLSRQGSWLADGNSYAKWLGRNVANLSAIAIEGEFVPMVTEVHSKALTLGYTDRIIHSMLLVMIEKDSITAFTSLFRKMKVFEQRKYLNAITTALARHFLNTTECANDAPLSNRSLRVAGATGLIGELIKDNDNLKSHLITSLTRSGIPALDDSLAARRSVIAAIAKDDDQLHTLLENSLKIFGDPYYIRHTPIIQQEALAQTLAMACGYVQRLQPMFLTIMAKSNYHISGMSNRIGSSSPRTRFLGLAVGVAISKMTDKPESQLKFELEGEEAAEAQLYERLTHVNDSFGNISDLKGHDEKPSRQPARKHGLHPVTKDSSRPAITEVQGPRIIELLSDEDDNEDDDLVPYEKPDSDLEDETDDPTEINRNKPTAPVYIRDLIAGLRDTEDYDRHTLALSTAASLIRRKANFGSEVLDHIQELAIILVGLNDSFELESFGEQRQQGLTAVLLAKPAAMAQWFSRSFFSGDYSLTQRTAILTTLGLGARELAGLKDATEALTPPTSSFPSKQLPPHLHTLYASTTPSSTPLARITSNMTTQLLSPLAAQAADSLTGPSILKVGQTRTFSSRMQVEARRSKPIPNALSQLVASNFFFPLTGRWWLAVRASASSASSIYTSTHLLPTFLQTLALLMNASGPNTLALPQMTREMWELLLSCRAHALGDKRILSALLFALLMLLETNLDKERLATEQGKELLETQEWVRGVFDELPSGKDGEEDEKVRVLAAGVVVRCQEVVEKYQRRLVGSMMDY